MKLRITISLAIALSIFSTCTSDVYNPDVCFQQNVLPIFVSKCSTPGCHNSVDKVADYDFSNYDGIMKGVKANHPLLSEVYNVVKGNNPSMPVGNKLSRIEVSYIKLWIKMGAKNTSNCATCDTSAYTYKATIKPLIDTWCVGCHNSANSGGGYDLSDYLGVKVSILNDRFLGSIKHDVGYSAMPKGTSKMNDCDVAKIENWVNSGSPDN